MVIGSKDGNLDGGDYAIGYLVLQNKLPGNSRNKYAA